MEIKERTERLQHWKSLAARSFQDFLDKPCLKTLRRLKEAAEQVVFQYDQLAEEAYQRAHHKE